MIRITIICLSVLFLSSASFAEVIHFKDGRKLAAKVLEKNAQSVKVDLNGINMTYYIDEIQDIDGQPIAGPVPTQPLVAAPVAAVPLVSEFIPSGSRNEDPAAKKKLILEFIDVFGTRTAMTRNFDTLMNALAQQKPAEATKIKEKFKIDEVIERIVPLYDKYFTSEELKAYINFYSSPMGHKLIVNIGSVMKDSVDVGTTYLKEKFPEMVDK